MDKIKLFKNIKLLDKILLSHKSNFTTYSITDINFIKGHSIFINRYRFINKNFFFYHFFKKLILQIIFFFTYLFCKLTESIFTFKNKINIRKVDVVFVSHFVENNKNINIDFYFSNLPHLLDNNSIKSSIIYFKSIKKSKIDKIYFNKFNFIKYKINSFSLLKIFLNILKESYRIIKLYFNTNNKNYKKILLFCLINLFKVSTFKNNIAAYEFEIYLKKIRPKLIFITHEGHPYERLFFNVARKLNIKSIGFTTGIFLPFQYGNNRDLKKEFNPDYISYQSNLIKLISNKKIETKKIVIGNNKIFDEDTIQIKNYNKLNILVLPEGLYEEEKFFFLNIVNFALINKNINYFVRLHPISDFRSILKKMGINELPNNIILSKKDFFEDIKRCNYALYRGTTAIIFAVKYGLIPLYLSKENEISINPLFKLKDNIHYINKYENIKNIYDNHNFYENYKLKHKEIMDYCKNYFENFNVDIVKEIIK